MLLNPARTDAAGEVGVDTGFPRAAPAWSAGTRFLFRFGFAYLILYCLPFPLHYIPYVSVVAEPYEAFWNALVPWVGKALFGLEITVVPNGSGDTSYNYVQMLCFFGIALAAALIWTALDRKRPKYERLYEVLRAYVRLTLAVAMISYGAIKIVKSQFPDPSIDRLLQPFGDASPMGLLWTFMSASAAYNVFAGASEMLGGLLLTFRRTTLLGALVSAGAMANVAMLNFSYDVPVKLYSIHLLLMAVFLMLPDLRRLAGLFVLHRAVPPAEVRPFFRRRWMDRTALAARTAFILFILYFAFSGALANRKRYLEKPKFFGVWNVQRLVIDGRERPFVVDDGGRWHRVVFSSPNILAIQDLNGHRQRYLIDGEETPGTWSLSSRQDPDFKAKLSYAQPRPDILELQGDLEGRSIQATLHKGPIPPALLTERGFHWINERPFNR
ncbi:MAG: hypothetical protein ACJ75H_04640 [Thermoanaerobaculia bacterium]